MDESAKITNPLILSEFPDGNIGNIQYLYLYENIIVNVLLYIIFQEDKYYNGRPCFTSCKKV